MADFWIKDGEKFLMIGDSITDAGSRAEDGPWGHGYVRTFIELVTARYPERNIEFLNRGVGGNTVANLRTRWADDVLYHKPDKMSLMVGINDINKHLLDHKDLMGNPDGVDPDTYAQVYDEILDLTKRELGIPIVLLTPFYISTDRTKGQSYRSKVLELLPRYLETVENMSAKYGTKLLRTHEVFQNVLKYHDPHIFTHGGLAADAIHPNTAGYTVIASALFDLLHE